MLQKFSDKIYYTKHRYMLLEPAIGYIKGSNFSVMIDTGNSKKQVEEFLKELEEEGLPKPAYAILTHHHWDHSFGAAYIDIPVIATDRAKNHLANMQTWKWDDESLNERCKNNEDVEYSVNVFKKIYGKERDVRIKLPDIVKYSDIKLNIGDDNLICYYSDNSHSDDAFLIYVEKERLLFVGDSMSKNYLSNGYDKEKLEKYIAKIESIDFDYAIPGHVNIYTKQQVLDYLNKEYTKLMR